MSRRDHTLLSPHHLEAFEFLEKKSSPGYDLSSATPITAASSTVLKEAISSGQLSYAHFTGESRGSEDVLKKCTSFFQKHGIKCKTKNIALFSDGITSAIGQAYNLLKVKSILVPTPTFGYFFKQLNKFGISFVTIPTNKDSGFLIDPEELEKSIIKNNIRVLLICYPNNPTGVVITEENARAIAEVVKRYNVFVIQDAIFLENSLSSETNKNFLIAAVEGMLDRSLTLYSTSKMMSHAADHVAVGVGPEDLVKDFAKLGGHSVFSERVFTSAVKEIEENHEYFEDARQKYLNNIWLVNTKIEVLNEKFSKIFGEQDADEQPYVKPYIEIPEAGNVYLLDFSGLKGKIFDGKEMLTGLDISKFLLENASVATVPGECFFFPEESMLVRISLGHPIEYISEAFNSIIYSVEKLNVVEKTDPRSSPSSSKAKPLSEAAMEAMKSIKSRL